MMPQQMMQPQPMMMSPMGMPMMMVPMQMMGSGGCCPPQQSRSSHSNPDPKTEKINTLMARKRKDNAGVVFVGGLRKTTDEAIDKVIEAHAKHMIDNKWVEVKRHDGMAACAGMTTTLKKKLEEEEEPIKQEEPEPAKPGDHDWEEKWSSSYLQMAQQLGQTGKNQEVEQQGLETLRETGQIPRGPPDLPVGTEIIEQKCIAFLIGKGGQALSALNAQAGVSIQIDQSTKSIGYSMANIYGTEDGAVKAKIILRQKISEYRPLR